MAVSAVLVELGRMFRFGLVGLCATLVYALATTIAIDLLAAGPVLASIFGVTSSTVVSYLGHSAFSFRVTTHHRACLGRFLVVAALVFGLATGTTWLITQKLKLPTSIAIAAVTILIPIVSYVCTRFWVFMPGPVQANLALEPTANEATDFDARSR